MEICTCNVGRLEVESKSDNRLVLSLAQDFIHCATRGRKKIPKHLALPLAIKHMVGSTRVVTLFNRLGHGLSATQVGEIEAGMSQQILSQQGVSAPAFVLSISD